MSTYSWVKITAKVSDNSFNPLSAWDIVETVTASCYNGSQDTFFKKTEDDRWILGCSGMNHLLQRRQMLQNCLDDTSQPEHRWTVTQNIMQEEPKTFWRKGKWAYYAMAESTRQPRKKNIRIKSQLWIFVREPSGKILKFCSNKSVKLNWHKFINQFINLWVGITLEITKVNIVKTLLCACIPQTIRVLP